MLTDTITVVKGDTDVQLVTLSDNLSNLINDATANYTLCVKSAVTDADPGIFTETVQQSTPGNAFITIQPADTAALTPPNVLLYDIRVKETSGRVTTIASGKFIVLPPVHNTP